MMLVVGVVQVVHGGVERGGLAGAGGAGHHHDAARRVERVALQRLEHARRHADVADRQQRLAVVEQPQHDLLAVDGHVDRDADVDQAARRLVLDAPVLVATAFGDVGARHHFDAAHHGDGLVVRHVLVHDHHAVLPEADAQVLAPRFEVDVADALRQRVVEHGVHERHGTAAVGCRWRHRGAGEQLFLGPGDRRDHALARTEAHDEVGTEVPARRLLVLGVQRVGEGDQHPLALAAHRQERVRPAGGHRRPLEQSQIERLGVDGHRGHVQQVGPGRHHVGGVHEVVVDEDVFDRRLRMFAPLRQGQLQVMRLEPAQFDQHVAERGVDQARAQRGADLRLGHELELDEHRRQGARRLDLLVDARGQRQLVGGERAGVDEHAGDAEPDRRCAVLGGWEGAGHVSDRVQTQNRRPAAELERSWHAHMRRAARAGGYCGTMRPPVRKRR